MATQSPAERLQSGSTPDLGFLFPAIHAKISLVSIVLQTNDRWITINPDSVGNSKPEVY